MNFERLKRRVERRETLLEARAQQTLDARDRLRRAWREGWTPARIVVAGLLGGFLAGRAPSARTLRRVGRLGSPKTLQTINALVGLLASLQAAFAAMTAKGAADTAEQAADSADSAAASAGEAVDEAVAATGAEAEADAGDADPLLPPSARRRRPEPGWQTPPRPAEAATDVSEQR